MSCDESFQFHLIFSFGWFTSYSPLCWYALICCSQIFLSYVDSALSQSCLCYNMYIYSYSLASLCYDWSMRWSIATGRGCWIINFKWHRTQLDDSHTTTTTQCLYTGWVTWFDFWNIKVNGWVWGNNLIKSSWISLSAHPCTVHALTTAPFMSGWLRLSPIIITPTK